MVTRKPGNANGWAFHKHLVGFSNLYFLNSSLGLRNSIVVLDLVLVLGVSGFGGWLEVAFFGRCLWW